MRTISARKHQVVDDQPEAYSPPRLFTPNFSDEQLARIQMAPDRDAEVAKLYLEFRRTLDDQG